MQASGSSLKEDRQTGHSRIREADPAHARSSPFNRFAGSDAFTLAGRPSSWRDTRRYPGSPPRLAAPDRRRLVDKLEWRPKPPCKLPGEPGVLLGPWEISPP